VTLRFARASDAPAMVRTAALGFATYRAFGPAGWHSPDPETAEPGIRERLADSRTRCVFAEAHGEAAGHVAWFPDPQRSGAYLWQLFVRPRWFGTGLAAGLHDAFLERAAADGWRRARLLTPAAHARARRFYAGRGWRTDGPPRDERAFGMPLVVLVRDRLP
jgi:GNAT superfamily N-acetyltransferase